MTSELWASDCRQIATRKASIVLNNSAVSLLLNGHIHEALETFEDAVKIQGIGECTSTANTNQSEHEVNVILGRLYRRMACCTTKTALKMDCASGDCPRSSSVFPMLQVVSNHCSPARIYEALTSCPDSTYLNVVFPMKIEQLDDQEEIGEEDFMMEHALMLYNYGVTYEAAAASAGNEDNVAAQSTFQSKAFDMFQWCSAILAQIDLESQHQPFSFRANQLLLLQLAVTHSLVNASTALRLHVEYHEYCRIIEILLHMVEDRHKQLPINEHLVASAA